MKFLLSAVSFIFLFAGYATSGEAWPVTAAANVSQVKSRDPPQVIGSALCLRTNKTEFASAITRITNIVPKCVTEGVTRDGDYLYGTTHISWGTWQNVLIVKNISPESEYLRVAVPSTLRAAADWRELAKSYCNTVGLSIAWANGHNVSAGVERYESRDMGENAEVTFTKDSNGNLAEIEISFAL